MKEAPECVGMVGHMFGHRMEPRYDRHEVRQWWQELAGYNAQNVPVEPAEDSRTYICDVCERCGHTIRREAA